MLLPTPAWAASKTRKEASMVALVNLVPGATIFRLGSGGPAVRQFQLALAKFGYPLSGTGYFGTATDTAVTAFQKLHSISVTGAIDKRTAEEIDRALASVVAAPLSAPLSKFVGRPLWLQAGIGLIGTKEGAGEHDNPVLIDWA